MVSQTARSVPRSAVCPSKVSWLCSKPPVARSRASSSAAEKSSGPYSSKNISPLYAARYAARNAPGLWLFAPQARRALGLDALLLTRS